MTFNEKNFRQQIEDIRCAAHAAHADVNQFYGDGKPYGYHLDMVARQVHEFGHLICKEENDILPLYFAAYFHDSIEDARLSYNDVKKKAHSLGLSEEQSHLAAEIVYALTNDKGRTRKERAGENYYRGIRQTPYAPFCKMCDRLANMAFSATQGTFDNNHMLKVYCNELPDFLRQITVEHPADIRFTLPQPMIDKANTYHL